MKKEKQGFKITSVLYNVAIIGSAIIALTSGFKVL
ncbi:hypothetical protein J2S25_000528 [Mesobacillus stamsii]|uniref:Uncharacterized protein n=1 Tax=Mesobacillus stamsii TaxID=225347 RepID=A0ABU0FR23_9BACI|nr:hypothetical protein [Mesobacillus stamsii]